MATEAMGTSELTAMRKWLPLAGVIAAWVPVMVAASYGWRHGDYYDYGWFVPPAALLLMVRRWRDLPMGRDWVPGRGWLLGLLGMMVWIWVLRVLGYADPNWRLPMILLAATAVLTSHGILACSGGRQATLAFVWISLFLGSAVPWPTVVETTIVRQLTEWVVTTVAEVFQILGKPVEVVGDRLRLHETTVEVTDGCSGVRSFQSFVMATWFFVEWQRLRWRQAMVLLACGCGMGLLINMVRTYALARIRFDWGQLAFERAHDWLGIAAFLMSGLFFYLLAGRLGAPPRRKVISTRANPSA